MSETQEMTQEQAKVADVTMSQIIDAAKGDFTLAKQMSVLAEKKDYIGLFKLAIENRGKVEEQIKDMETLAPVVKEGYKTTEFWLVIAYLILNGYFMWKGTPLPFADDTTLGGVIAAYTGGRHLIKNTQSK